MAEITRRSVLLEALSIMREELNVCSKGYNGLIPKDGMVEAWEQARKKVKIMEEITQAFESEPVRAAVADWQQEVMEHGPSPLKLDGGTEPEAKMDGGYIRPRRLGRTKQCGLVMTYDTETEEEVKQKLPEDIKAMVGAIIERITRALLVPDLESLKVIYKDKEDEGGPIYEKRTLAVKMEAKYK